MRARLLPLLLLVLLILPSLARAEAPPAPPATTAPSAAELRQVLHVLNDPRRRAEFTATLNALLHAAPAAPAVVPAPAASAPATPPPAAAPAAKPAPPAPAIDPNGVGAELVTGFAGWVTGTMDRVWATSQAMTNYSLFWRWLEGVTTDPATMLAVRQAAWRAALAIAGALLVERLLARPARRIRARIADAAPSGRRDAPPVPEPEAVLVRRRGRRLRSTWTLVRRLPFMLLALMVDLLPVLGFVAAGYALLAAGLGRIGTVRLVIQAVVDGYVFYRLVMIVARALLSPHHGRLRLLQVSDGSAAYAIGWTRRIVGLTVFGVIATNVAVIFGLYTAAHDALLKLVMLLVHGLLAMVILQCRGSVAARLRAPAGARGTWASVRNGAAGTWHIIALALDVGSWLVWAVELPNGFSRLLHFLLVSALVLVAARLLSILLQGALDRAVRLHPETAALHPALQQKATRYYALARRVLGWLIGAATMVALLEAWGVSVLPWFASGRLGARLLSSGGAVIVTLFIALVAWEAANAAIQGRIAQLSMDDQVVRSARLRTLLPLLRSVILAALVLVAGMTVLSEIGLNIAPLLAGAGVIGVAVGFGSQTLVKDIITGLFLLMEDAMQVGNWITVAGLSGKVEHLSIRTIRLRAADGSVHIIPFSSVSTVTNTNRGLGNASVSVSVSLREDTDRVGEVLTQIALEMRQDPAFSSAMLSDLQLWGVDKVDAATVTIVGQIVCTDTGRWGVQREFNRRMKKQFEALGIEIAAPAQTVVIPQALSLRLDGTRPEGERLPHARSTVAAAGAAAP